MKVDKLYILSLDYTALNLAAIDPSAKALEARRKHKSPTGAVAVLYLKDKHLGFSSNFQEPLDKEFETELKEIRSSTTSNIGLYIAAHGVTGGGYKVGGHNSSQLAELVAAIKFPALRKICVETCNMTRPYLQDFCKQLYDKSNPKLAPMVAGYSTFVTVVGSSATDGKTVYDVGGDSRELIDQASAAMVGKKVVRGSDVGLSHYSSLYLLRSPSNPGTEKEKKALSMTKFVVQYRSGGPVDLTLDDWHDA